ncbi:MAG: GNAT family N-acetyltransferase [Anaerolineae bacterium]
MSSIHVRGATLDDTSAISSLFRDRITVWQRLNTAEQVVDVPYHALTIYERWLHGGPWMSVETAAIHLSHLLRGAGIPLVGEADGHVVAYAEAYRGSEPDPYGDHLHLAQLVIHPDHATGNIPDVIVSDLLDQARVSRCGRLTADCPAGDIEAQTLYTRHGMRVLSRINRYNLPARSGQGFYKVVDHQDESAAQIAGWFMSAGRLGSARQQWETLWPRTWDAIPEIRERRAYRLHFSASGQEALIYCQQQMYLPRAVEVYLWSPKPLTSQMLTALRDWTYREGFRTLVMAATDETAKVLGNEAEADGYSVDVFGVQA